MGDYTKLPIHFLPIIGNKIYKISNTFIQKFFLPIFFLPILCQFGISWFCQFANYWQKKIGKKNLLRFLNKNH
jgi:hypothetical protein